MLLDPPEALVDELNRRYTAVAQAQANYSNNASALNLLVLNTARKALEKTLDKCSLELGRPTLPRPSVVALEDQPLKLQYAA